MIGGSGSGKTRFYVKPNLMQMPQKVSYVVTDPKGTIIIECGKMLSDAGYRVNNGKRDPQFTCSQYSKIPCGTLCGTQHRIRAEAVLTLITDMLRAIAEYSKNDRAEFIRTVQETQAAQQTADISKKRKRLAAAQKRAGELERLICKIYEDNALGKLPDARYEALDAQYAKEQDALNAEITELEKAVTGYEQSRKSAEKFIALTDKYENFDTLTNTIVELRDLMAYDEMELDLLGDRRTALFVIISDTDDTFNFVVSIMYTQLFNLLCDRADDQCGGQLKYHVRLLLDEFANIGLIPKFDKLIATIRSREISASIILQSQSQLKTIYKDAAETIIGNCDTMLFLGGKESSTLKEISETLGKETIDLYKRTLSLMA